MNQNEKPLSATELVAVLHNSPERVVARMSYPEQKALLASVVLGEAKVSEAVGAALLDALRLQPQDVGKAIEHVANMRRRNIEGRQSWEQLQAINAALKPKIEALTEKTVEVFGPDFELIRPPVFEIDYRRDLCEVFNAPILQPLADEVTEAMAGYAEAARFAQPFEEQVTCGDLFDLADRRRESASDAARRAS